MLKLFFFAYLIFILNINSRSLNFIIKNKTIYNMDQSTKDMLAGFFSGWIQVLIMQPFELVKIRLQSQPI